MSAKSSISGKRRKDLLKKPNVIGVGVGYREKEGKRTDEETVVVFVTKKVPREELGDGEIVPRTVAGKKIDVIEIGEVRFLEEEEEQKPPQGVENSLDRLKRHRPAPGGVSIGHYKISAGTLGAVVKDRATGARLILSNNHVLAHSSSGDDGRAAPGDAVLQPGPHDGGTMDTDILARLERFVPLRRTFGRAHCSAARMGEKAINRLIYLLFPHYRVLLQRADSRENLVDAALARPLRDDYVADEILGLGRIRGEVEAYLGQPVLFSGRTSGVVRGKIIAREVSLYVTMGPGEQVYFTDQLISSAVSRPGDSGALLMDHQNRAVGLLFAGSARVSVCNRIAQVRRLLKIDFA